jgi:glyoxylase-like metal-dependent hydrolase (beta-lactamase superfamily II)/cell division septum initiation protein DivIVA
MQEITEPLSELPHDPVAAVASADFPLVLRGYDREAVDEYVRRTTQLVAELYATRSAEGAVRRALERVGEQVSSILARAHETAEGITSQSREEADERLGQARAQAQQLERDARALAEELERDARERARERERAAELRVHELDAEVERIWAERDRIVSDVRRLSEELADLASAAAARFPAATTDEAGALARPEEDEVPAGSGAGFPAAPELDAGPAPAFEAWHEPDGAAGVQAEFPSESGAELREVPGDVRDDPFATVEQHAAPGEAAAASDLVPEDPVSPAEQPTTVLSWPRTRVIDLRHLGRERVIGCWQVDDVLIDPGPASCLKVLLAALEEQPRALLLTHIHLDHAGAAGSLVRRWPELEVYVHERGAQHLVDPTKLVESARRLYGDEMERLWGEVLPVPEANLRVLDGGERLLGGRFEVAYTPGHASHHVSYLYGRTAFVGDVGGVRITPETLVIPPTPPPDIDLDAWHSSIGLVLRWRPDRLAITHFGESAEVERQLAEVADRLDTWAALARTEDLVTFVDVVESEIERGSSAAHREAYKQAAPPEQLYAGLERYWRKREAEADATSAQEPETNETERFAPKQRRSATEASTHAGRSARANRSFSGK